MRHSLLLPASVLLIALTSCAATFNNIPTVIMTAPLNDNAALSCSVAEILWPVPSSTPRTLHLKATQGTYVWEDSLLTTAGTQVTFLPPYFPTNSLVTLTGWASDVGGAGCPMIITKTPTIITKAPAKPTLSAP
jgi:hypothetical protein